MSTIKRSYLCIANKKYPILFSSFGFMLIELLIALAIGSLIVSVILEIFLASMHSYQLQRSLNQLQANAATVIDILRTDIHRAGYIGCARLTNDFPIASHLPDTLSPKNKITSLHDGEISVSYMDLSTAMLIESLPDMGRLTADSHVRFHSGYILIIADCKHADIFQAAAVKKMKDKQIIYSVSPLQYHYAKGAEIGQFKINTYFIADTYRKHLDGTPIYSLFFKDHYQDKFELVEDIQNMTIRFAIKNGESIVELPAKDVIDSSTIVGAAIDFTTSLSSIKKNWHFYSSI